MSKLKITITMLLVCLIATFIAGCGGTTEPSSHELSETVSVLDSISVSPEGIEMGLDKALNYNALGKYEDETLANITSTVVWSSSSNSVATVSPVGLVTTTGYGTTEIIATQGEVTGSTTLTVPITYPQQSIPQSPSSSETTVGQIESVSISPSTPTLREQDMLQLKALAPYSDGTSKDVTTEVVWTTSNTNVATITELGLVEAMAGGETKITAAFQGGSDSIVLTVESLIDPETIPEDDAEDSMMSMVTSMLTMMLENPQGMMDTAIGMIRNGTMIDMLKWLFEPGVFTELLRFVGQMLF